MACNYSANQYDSAYKPKILRNWEVPKQYSIRPQRRISPTKVIANSRGHILPGIKRANKNPWGDFVGTWHLPKKIDRKTAEELSKQYKCTKKGTENQIKELNEHPIVDEDKEILIQDENRNHEDPNKAIVPYVPGDLTDDKYRLPSHEELAINRHNSQEKLASNGFPRTRNDFSRVSPEPPKDLTEQVNEIYGKHKEMLTADLPDVHNNKPKKKDRILSPILAAINNFSLAKKLHKENLEHVPLPDTVTDSVYRRLQMQREGKEPGLGLKDENFATGVGWKGYQGYGPTRCTKLKVYRPKTCGHVEKKDANNDRPSSVSSFDKRWRFIRQSKVSPIDLAICWDLTPEDPNDEPKRTTHIDGSNGSSAPAVFTLVHTPKDEPEEKVEKKCDGVHSCGPIFEHGAKNNTGKDFIFDRPRTSAPRQSHSSKSSSVISSESSKKRAKSAGNLNEDPNEKLSNKSEPKQDGVHQSTPNLSDDGSKCKSKNCPIQWKGTRERFCVACELKNAPSVKARRPKTDYKMAFKAGVPQNNCKDKRQDYPEHWRLATVYQHSYKPIHTRKRPLLQTVFK